MNHTRCGHTTWGIMITDKARFRGRRCCCNAYKGNLPQSKLSYHKCAHTYHISGDLLEVTMELDTHFYPNGLDWHEEFANDRNAKTRELSRRLTQELQHLVGVATNDTTTSFQ